MLEKDNGLIMRSQNGLKKEFEKRRREIHENREREEKEAEQKKREEEKKNRIPLWVRLAKWIMK